MGYMATYVRIDNERGNCAFCQTNTPHGGFMAREQIDGEEVFICYVCVRNMAKELIEIPGFPVGCKVRNTASDPTSEIGEIVGIVPGPGPQLTPIVKWPSHKKAYPRPLMFLTRVQEPGDESGVVEK